MRFEEKDDIVVFYFDSKDKPQGFMSKKQYNLIEEANKELNKKLDSLWWGKDN